MILEAQAGGWSPAFRRLVDWIARSSAVVQADNIAATSLRIAQRISCTLARENVRAILRRQGEPSTSSYLRGWDEATSL